MAQAQQDPMEQAKEVLRQVIKYRFWISITVAALFATIAYVVGSKPVREATAKEVGVIKAAETDVKQYVSPAIPNAQYKPIVEEKTAVLTTDVNAAWKTLFDRQAPLLTWPDTVQERFRKWGRKWPEDEDKAKVLFAIIDYMAAYPAYVTMVYKSFKPFDYETGEGIVVAAPEQALLRPAVFLDEKPPTLDKVWSAQERLWIQRTLLEVVAQVNKNAKNWDSAIIKQIDVLEVGNAGAQDQRSLAKSEELAEAPKIYPPGEEAPAEEAGGGGGPMSGMGAAAMPGAGGRRMGAMMGGGGMAAAQDGGSVYYLKSGNESQYKILPILLTVLIEQDRIQDLLVELENSPMSIEVKDFEMVRPSSKVIKPEKGTTPYGGGMMGGGMAGMMGGMMRRGGMMGRTGFGGPNSEMMGGMMGGGMMGGMMGGGMRNMMGGGGMPGMMGGAAAVPERKGINKRNEDSKKVRTEKEKSALESKGPSLFDPYFDIVQVTVYGQARFFNPPPDQPAAEPSPGETAATPATATPAPAAGTPAAGASAAQSEPATAGSPTAKAAPTPTPSPAADAPAAKSTTSPPADGAAAKKGNDEPAKPAAPPAKTGDAKSSTPKS